MNSLRIGLGTLTLACLLVLSHVHVCRGDVSARIPAYAADYRCKCLCTNLTFPIDNVDDCTCDTLLPIGSNCRDCPCTYESRSVLFIKFVVYAMIAIMSALALLIVLQPLFRFIIRRYDLQTAPIPVRNYGAPFHTSVEIIKALWRRAKLRRRAAQGTQTRTTDAPLSIYADTADD